MNSKCYLGSCLCGQVRYQVNKLEPLMGHCHCSMCRKFHGAAFATFGEAKIENFTWLSGEANLTDFMAENGTIRRFCASCGSSMIFVSARSPEGVVEFALATLDTDVAEKPDAHIFTSNKANWYSIHDSLPQYKKARTPDDK